MAIHMSDNNIADELSDDFLNDILDTFGLSEMETQPSREPMAPQDYELDEVDVEKPDLPDDKTGDHRINNGSPAQQQMLDRMREKIIENYGLKDLMESI